MGRTSRVAACGFVALLVLGAASASAGAQQRELVPPSGEYEGTLVQEGSGQPATTMSSREFIECDREGCTIGDGNVTQKLRKVAEGRYEVDDRQIAFEDTEGCAPLPWVAHAEMVVTGTRLEWTVSHPGTTDPVTSCGVDAFTHRFTGTLVPGTAPTTTTTTTTPPTTTTSGKGAPDTGSDQGRGSGPGPSRATPPSGLSPQQRRSWSAVQAGTRSAVPASIVAPADAVDDLGRAGQNLAIAAALVLLLVFPAQLFNSTFEEHHERIERSVVGRFVGRRRRAAVAARDLTDQPMRRSRSVATFLGVAAGGALIAGFLDPGFGIDAASVGLFLGVLASILVGAAIAGAVKRAYLGARDHDRTGYLDAVPSGLLIAAACVLVSRLVGFQPGYLYGLVGGVAFVAVLDDKESGESSFLGLLVALAVAFAAWFGLDAISASANGAHPGVPVLVADALLGALFIGGIEGTLFSLVPLRGLPGHTVSRWRWSAWTFVAGVTTFLFVHVLLRPSTGYLGQSSTASVAVTIGLLVAFGLLSVGAWGWFRLRPEDPLTRAGAPLHPDPDAGIDATP